ncbi:MAG: protein kinase domain-containing protein [Gemmataceae bacterium]
MTACPASDVFERFLTEELSATDVAAVEAHVEACSQCQERLAKLSEASVSESFSHSVSLSRSDVLTAEPEPVFLERLKNRGRNSFASNDGHGANVAEKKLPVVAGYEVLEELGRGGMGVVYRARHVGLNRLVALKMLPASHFVTEMSRQRFHREAQAIGRLHHTNIVQIFDYGESDSGPYFSLELIEGGNLSKCIDGAAWKPREAAAFLKHLAEAIEYAHANGVIHRDLKPANVLVEPITDHSGQSWKPKITDFGLAKCVGSESLQTANGAVLGTPSYLAPEQVTATSEKVGPATDVYGLGAILYEMLTGRPPFRGDSVMSTLLQVTHQEALAPSRSGIRVPKDLETILLKCLQKSQKDRYESAQALADELRRFLDDEPILAHPPGRIERTFKWARRNRTVATLIIAFTLSLFIGLGFAGWTMWGVAARQRAVDANVTQLLEETISLYGQALGADRDLQLWSKALATAQRAQDVAVTGGAAAELRNRAGTLLAQVRQGDRDRRLVVTLAEIQIAMGDNLRPDGGQDFAYADEAYGRAFADFGADVRDPQVAANQLRAIGEAQRIPVAQAIDHWGYVRLLMKNNVRDYPHDYARLLQLSRLLDPDPLRNRIRDAVIKGDRTELWATAQVMNLVEQPASTCNFVGVCLTWFRIRNDFSKSIEFLRRAQQSHPSDFQINHNLAFALIRGGRSDEAERFGSVALAMRPTSAAARQIMAECWTRLGRIDEALAMHRQVLAVAENSLSHYYWIGKILEIQGKPSEAVVAYRDAARRIPRVEPLYAEMLPQWKQFKLLDEVASEYRRELESRPDNADVRYGLYRVLYEANRWNDCIVEAGKLIEKEKNPNRLAGYLYGRAICCRNAARFSDAVNDLKQSLEKNPQHGRAKFELERIERLIALEQRSKLDESNSLTTAEGLELAEAKFRWQKQYAESAKLYAQTFAHDPAIADDLNKDYRLSGYCAAALASKNASSAEERNRWQTQAIDWLRADWAAHAAKLLTVPAHALRIEDSVLIRNTYEELTKLLDVDQAGPISEFNQSVMEQLQPEFVELNEKIQASGTSVLHSGNLSRDQSEVAYPLKLSAGMTVRVELKSSDFDSFLRLEDAQHKILIQNDNAGANTLNSRITFTAKTDGEYQLVATSYLHQGTGRYTISIRQFAAAKENEGKK